MIFKDLFLIIFFSFFISVGYLLFPKILTDFFLGSNLSDSFNIFLIFFILNLLNRIEVLKFSNKILKNFNKSECSEIFIYDFPKSKNFLEILGNYFFVCIFLIIEIFYILIKENSKLALLSLFIYSYTFIFLYFAHRNFNKNYFAGNNSMRKYFLRVRKIAPNLKFQRDKEKVFARLNKSYHNQNFRDAKFNFSKNTTALCLIHFNFLILTITMIYLINKNFSFVVNFESTVYFSILIIILNLITFNFFDFNQNFKSLKQILKDLKTRENIK